MQIHDEVGIREGGEDSKRCYRGGALKSIATVLRKKKKPPLMSRGTWGEGWGGDLSKGETGGP